MVTSGVGNRFYQHSLQIALSIATYIISSGMSVLGGSVQGTNLEMMSILTSNTHNGITTYVERSAMPTPKQPMPTSRCAMFTEDSTCFDIFPVSWATSRSLTSSILCRSACLTTSRSGFSTTWRRTNGSTSTMQSGYPFLLTTTSHKKVSHMRKILNRMRRRWRKWASTYLELWPSLYEAEAPFSVPYSIAQLSAHGHCWNSICMLDINLTMMQLWATWRTPCVIFTRSKMFSYLGELAKRRRPKPMPWEWNSWRS